MEAPKRIWRDDLALAMLAGWVNAPVDKMPPEMRAHTCEATAIAWGRVANAAREHLASENDRLMAEKTAEIERLRTALRGLVNSLEISPGPRGVLDLVPERISIARAALGGDNERG